ncbi:MAG: transposase [Ignavibacteria bacterium]|nr:transposase [Ignavibacteria bacterium]
MRNSGREFTDEFKLGSLREVERGRSVHEVAVELGIEEKSIYRWQKEFSAQKDSGMKTMKELEAEIRQMRKHAVQAEMEAAI